MAVPASAGPPGADLTVDVALAATRTAWTAWPHDAPVAAYVVLLRECLERARPAAARPR